MKKDSKHKLFEMLEAINPDLEANKEDWAIFRVSRGYGKCFVTSLSDVMGDGIRTCDYSVKYSDPTVMKFSLERAKEIIRKNIGVGDKLGVVNDRGVQKLYDWRIKYPDNYDDDGNDIG